MSVFREICRALLSWNTRFEIHAFALLPTIYQVVIVNHLQFQVLEICNKYKKSVKGQVQACWTNMFRNHCWRQQKFLNFWKKCICKWRIYSPNSRSKVINESSFFKNLFDHFKKWNSSLNYFFEANSR